MFNTKVSPHLILGLFLIILGSILVFGKLTVLRRRTSTNNRHATKMTERSLAFGYLFRNDQWFITMIVFTVLLVLPLTTLLAIGYALRIIRNLSYDINSKLPNWDNAMEMFVNGAKFTLV